MASDLVGTLIQEMRLRGVSNEVSRQVAETIRKQFGGAAVYVRAIDRESRDQKAAELTKLGASARTVAKVVGTHPSTIRRKRSAWL